MPVQDTHGIAARLPDATVPGDLHDVSTSTTATSCTTWSPGSSRPPRCAGGSTWWGAANSVARRVRGG